MKAGEFIPMKSSFGDPKRRERILEIINEIAFYNNIRTGDTAMAYNNYKTSRKHYLD